MAKEKVSNVYWIAVLLGFISIGNALFEVTDEDTCNTSLGMENGDIKNDQIKSSTWLYFQKRDKRYYRPYFARLNYKPSGGGWCSEDLHSFPDPYIEIDLKEDTKVTGVSTQGRHGGTEWVEKYNIEYQRNNDIGYRQYKENDKIKTFKGNNDTETVARRTFLKPIILRRIRIYPQGSFFAIYCTRIEVYGCKWNKAKDNLVSYSAPLGGVFDGVDLQDNTYDGYIQRQPDGLVLGGLGKLTNANYGKERVQSFSKIPSDWVGYTGSPVLIFRFAKSRRFQGIRFHVFNKLEKNIRLFSTVRISVSQDGKYYNNTLVYKPTPNYTKQIGAFSIQSHLGDIGGKFLKCIFQLPSKSSWLLLSEIDFNSDTMMHTNMPSPTLLWRALQTDNSDNSVEQRSFTHKNSRPTQPVPKPYFTKEQYQNNFHGVGVRREGHQRGLSFPIILTIVLVSIVIIVVMIGMLLRHVRRSKDFKKDKERQGDTETKRFTQVPAIPINNAAPDLLPDERISLCASEVVKFQRNHTPVPLVPTT